MILIDVTPEEFQMITTALDVRRRMFGGDGNHQRAREFASLGAKLYKQYHNQENLLQSATKEGA